MVQVTLIQIDNYGPWTVTPEPKREVDLQTLQSRLYADLCQLFGNSGCLVFFTRFDNMIAVSNGMTIEDHRAIQRSVRNRYPVTISMSVGSGDSPRIALEGASRSLQETGSAQDSQRREQLLGEGIGKKDETVQIAHFDVNNSTQRYTDELNAFDTFIHIEEGYATLMEYMWMGFDSMSFFVGGDNVISVASDLNEEDYMGAIEHVESEAEVRLKVGIGQGRIPENAGRDAKEGLEMCRETGKRVAFYG